VFVTQLSLLFVQKVCLFCDKRICILKLYKPGGFRGAEIALLEKGALAQDSVVLCSKTISYELAVIFLDCLRPQNSSPKLTLSSVLNHYKAK